MISCGGLDPGLSLLQLYKLWLEGAFEHQVGLDLKECVKMLSSTMGRGDENLADSQYQYNMQTITY